MEKLKEKLEKISPYLNERQRRIVYAAEAEQLGHGGKTLICTLTGMSRPTLNHGFQELSDMNKTSCDKERVRSRGAGRKKITSDYP
jgi:hypothetical protein